MKIIYCLLISCTILSCTERKNNNINYARDTNYTLDTAWNKAANAYVVSQPTGIGVDNADHIFVFQRTGRHWTDPFPDSLISQNTILELDNATGKLINAWGANQFIMPHGLAVDKANNIWVTDVALHQVFKFSHDGKLLMTLGVAKTPANDSDHFNLPTDIAFDDAGNVYVSDGYGNSRVVKFSAAGTFIKSWGSFGSKQGEFNIPHGITIDNKNNVYVADRQNNRIQVFDTAGTFLKAIKNDQPVEQLPSVTLDAGNRLFAIDYDPRKKADSTTNGSTFFGFDDSLHPTKHTGINASSERVTSWLHDIALDGKGNIYVGDITGLKVLKFKPVQPDK